MSNPNLIEDVANTIARAGLGQPDPYRAAALALAEAGLLTRPAAEPAPPPAPAALPADVRELLAALRDALDMPLPGIDETDERRHAAQLTRRASHAHIVVSSVLDGHGLDGATAQLRGWTDADPITYTPWADPRHERAAAPTDAPATGPAPRCPAAHPDDPTPCDGPPVVTVLDRHNAGLDGCDHHGARMLASLEGGRVYPLSGAPANAAIRVFKAAEYIRPFPWITGAPRTRAEAADCDPTRGGDAR